MAMKAIILAAGKGTRMKSDLIKVMHSVAGRPILSYVLDSVFESGIDDVVLVVGHQEEIVREHYRDARITFVTQKELLGTGHAVLAAESVLPLDLMDQVLVLAGDCPLIGPDIINSLIESHVQMNSKGTVLTTHMANPASYGRILRDSDGNLLGIKEARDCSQEERGVSEVNAGVYVFHGRSLFSVLKDVKTINQQQEYYLTDVIHLLRSQGINVSAYCSSDSEAMIGVNSRQDLALVSRIVYRRKVDELMSEGVTFVDPDQSYIDPTVKIGSDTIIHPFTVIQGDTCVGKRCTILPFVHLLDDLVQDGEVVGASPSEICFYDQEDLFLESCSESDRTVCCS